MLAVVLAGILPEVDNSIEREVEYFAAVAPFAFPLDIAELISAEDLTFAPGFSVDFCVGVGFMSPLIFLT